MWRLGLHWLDTKGKSPVKVLINAISIKEGGSKVVLMRLLSAMREARPDFEWIVAAHRRSIPIEQADPSVIWLSLPNVEASPLSFLRWYELMLPQIIREHRPKVLFSQTNYLPRRAVPCGTLLLVQNAGYFSAEFEALVMDSLESRLARYLWRRKSQWAHRSAKAADMVTVQTAALADAIRVRTGRSKGGIAVIPHGPGISAHRCSPPAERQTDVMRIGYVTKWGVQKNFRTLFQAARKLRDAGYKFRLILTLENDARETKNVLQAAQELGVEALIENYGELPFDKIIAIYDSLDIFVCPSFCESFGFPTVEAMARGLPVVVARTNENIEITRGAALDFPPFDADALASRLALLIEDSRERSRRGALSLSNSRSFTWEKAAAETVAAIESLG